jgi:hypothetical protein
MGRNNFAAPRLRGNLPQFLPLWVKDNYGGAGDREGLDDFDGGVGIGAAKT